MAVPASVPFLGPVGAWLTVGKQNLAELIRGEDTQTFRVPEDLKGHIGHKGHGPTLILGDSQAG